MGECLICQRVNLASHKKNPYLIAEFEHSFFVVGDHQFFPGYSLLLLKDHVRELHELEPSVYEALSRELMRAGKAVYKTFTPWKMNYACYGNSEQHVHWHVFPRYETDPLHKTYPWVHAEKFSQDLIDAKQAQEIAQSILKNL